MTGRLFRGVAACLGLAILTGFIGFSTINAAQAGELKLAHFMSPKHPMDRFQMRPWTKRVAEMSKGALTIKIYPGGELGKGPQAQFKRAVDGVADITFGLQGYTAALFPKTTLIEMPMVAADGVDATKRLWKAYDQIKSEYARVKVLGLWATDHPVLMTKSKPIRSINDIKGLKIRTPSKAQAALIKAFGATPVAMPITKAYQSLDTGVVDALMVPPNVIRSFKIGEVAKYYTTGLPFGRSPMFVVMNRKSWEALPSDQKALLEKVSGLEWSTKASATYEKASAKALDGMRKSSKHEVIALSADEVKKGREILLKARAKIIADLEKKGVPAKAVLKALGTIG